MESVNDVTPGGRHLHNSGAREKEMALQGGVMALSIDIQLLKSVFSNCRRRLVQATSAVNFGGSWRCEQEGR